MKAQERKLRLAKLKGELVERDRAVALVFRPARKERNTWVTWPARVAAPMADDITAALAGSGEVTIGTGTMQQILEAHVRAHLAELAEQEFRLRRCRPDWGLRRRAGNPPRFGRAGTRPIHALTVSEWADRHRWLSSRASAQRGRCRPVRRHRNRDIRAEGASEGSGSSVRCHAARP